MSKSKARGLVEGMRYIDDSPFAKYQDHNLKDYLDHTTIQTFVLMALMEFHKASLHLYCGNTFSELEPVVVEGEHEAYLEGNPMGWRKHLFDLEQEYEQYSSIALFFKGEEIPVTPTRITEQAFVWGIRTDYPLYSELVEPFQNEQVTFHPAQ